MRARYVGLIVVGGLTILALIPSTGLTQYPGGGSGDSRGGYSQGGSSGYGGSSRGGFSRGLSSSDPGTIFDSVAQGRTSVPLDDRSLWMFRESLTEWAKRTNFSGTSITKDQFVQYGQSPEAEAMRTRMQQRFSSRDQAPSSTPSTPSPSSTTLVIPSDRPVMIVGGQKPLSVATQQSGGDQRSGGGSDGRESYEFRRRDDNGDGVLSYDEMSSTLRGEREQWDTNRDGVVDQTEYGGYYRAFQERQNGGMSQGQQGFGQGGWGGDQGNNWNQGGGWNNSAQQSTDTTQNRPVGPDNPMRDPGTLANQRGGLDTELYIEVTGTKSGGNVWGTDIYTTDSRLARAAVHSGVVKEGEKKIIKVTFLGPQQSFTGSTRNEVTSSDYGPWQNSYKIEAVAARGTVFRAGKLPDNTPSWFKELDRDTDGQVALYEWKARDMEVDTFAGMDRNGDGLVTFQEAILATTQPKTGGTGGIVVADSSKRDSGRGNNPGTQGTPQPPRGFMPGGNFGFGQQGNTQGGTTTTFIEQRLTEQFKGKDTILLSEVQTRSQDKLRDFAKRKGLTDSITKDQYREYLQEVMGNQGGAFGRPGGDNNGQGGSNRSQR